MTQSLEGKIRKLESTKGYGFITGDDHKDYFFHMDDFLGHWKDLVEDVNHLEVRVEFQGEQTAKGMRARNVNRLDFPNLSR